MAQWKTIPNANKHSYATMAVSLQLVILLLVSSSEAFTRGLQAPRRVAAPSTATSLNFFSNWNKKPDEPEQDTKDDDDYEPDDLVERIFTTFFGKPEAEPFGMKRFDQNRFPEQYPATTTDFNVEPVSSDDRETAQLRSLLKNTNLEQRGLRLTYDANRDGWDPYKFHAKVDRQGPALVVCTTRLGLTCGGYNPKGWVGYGENRGSIAAFLFRRKLNGEWIKLKKVGGPSLAQMDVPEAGPSFGADALVIPLGKENPRTARSKLGSYYERMPDGENSLFGKDAAVQLTSFKVYHGVYDEGEFVPFTDAEPFALS